MVHVIVSEVCIKSNCIKRRARCLKYIAVQSYYRTFPKIKRRCCLFFRKILNELSGQPENRSVKEEAGDSKSSDSSESDSGGQVTSVPSQSIVYQNATGAGNY